MIIKNVSLFDLCLDQLLLNVLRTTLKPPTIKLSRQAGVPQRHQFPRSPIAEVHVSHQASQE